MGDDPLPAQGTLLSSRHAPSLRPNANSDARYAHAVSLIRVHGYSPYRAAHETGLDPSNLDRNLKRNNEKVPDAESRHRSTEERILCLAENLSETTGEKLIVDIENDRRKPAELIKAYSAGTNQVAAKRRWNQGLSAGDARTQDALASALEKLRDGASIRIEEPDPTDEVIDITAVITQVNQLERHDGLGGLRVQPRYRSVTHQTCTRRNVPSPNGPWRPLTGQLRLTPVCVIQPLPPPTERFRNV